MYHYSKLRPFHGVWNSAKFGIGGSKSSLGGKINGDKMRKNCMGLNIRKICTMLNCKIWAYKIVLNRGGKYQEKDKCGSFSIQTIENIILQYMTCLGQPL